MPVATPQLISGCDAATRIPSAEKIQNSFQLFKYLMVKKKEKKRTKEGKINFPSQ